MSLDEALAMIADEAVPPDLRERAPDATPPQRCAKNGAQPRRGLFNLRREAPTSRA